jgi:hypothetical protein
MNCQGARVRLGIGSGIAQRIARLGTRYRPAALADAVQIVRGLLRWLAIECETMADLVDESARGSRVVGRRDKRRKERSNALLASAKTLSSFWPANPPSPDPS